MSVKENCKEAVFQYLINQNRPYSANDVAQNLHKEFGKVTVQKALEDLTLECKIKEKIYGKQKVYSVSQNEDVGACDDAGFDLVALESKIEEMNEKLKSAEDNLKKTERILKDLEKEPPTEKALEEKNKLETIIVKLQEKIETSSKVTFEFTDQDKRDIRNTYARYEKEQRKRKQLCMDMVNLIMENYPKKLKNLFEEIGIEPDESKHDLLI